MRSSSLVFRTQHAGGLTSIFLLTLLVTSISPVNAQVVLTCPDDITVSNDPGVCSAVVEFPDPVVTGTNELDVVTITPASGSTFPVGTNEVVVTVTAGTTNLATCSFIITVVDTEPPAITDVSVNKSILWPPNHKLINVTVQYDSVDNCDPAPVCSLAVTSSEEIDGTGDGNTSQDWEVIDDHHVRLRAERSGHGTGRTYTTAITCVDQDDNSSSEDVTAVVPHDRGKHKGKGTNGNNGNAGGNGKGHGKGGGNNGHGHGHQE